MKAPDGRSVKALINATLIYSQEEVVESSVVTMQDMTPLEELERWLGWGRVFPGIRGGWGWRGA